MLGITALCKPRSIVEELLSTSPFSRKHTVSIARTNYESYHSLYGFAVR
jgi:uncharacterized protein YlxP (DUF503 family)